MKSARELKAKLEERMGARQTLHFTRWTHNMSYIYFVGPL